MGKAQTGWHADDAARDQGTDKEEVDERLPSHAPPHTGPRNIHHAERQSSRSDWSGAEGGNVKRLVRFLGCACWFATHLNIRNPRETLDCAKRRWAMLKAVRETGFFYHV